MNKLLLARLFNWVPFFLSHNITTGTTGGVDIMGSVYNLLSNDPALIDCCMGFTDAFHPLN